MNSKRILSISLLMFIAFSIVFLVHKEFSRKNHDDATTYAEMQTQNPLPKQNYDTRDKQTSAKESTSQAMGSQVIAYYFHGTYRCSTCQTIEQYSREAIEQYFSKELDNKTLEFKPLNVEDQENRHYIQDYELFTKSLVITLSKDDKQIKWKNLTDVWKYAGDKEKFYQYVKEEVENFLKELE
jgi:hypothetical protein